MDQQTRDAIELLWYNIYFRDNRALRGRTLNRREEELFQAITTLRSYLDKTKTLVERRRDFEAGDVEGPGVARELAERLFEPGLGL
jgi:hypothetical protein